MRKLLEGQVILVTGGSRGIGKTCVELLADHGAAVLLQFHHSEAAAQAIASAINARGGQVKVCRADLTQAADIKALFQCATTAYGRLDALVNNAGILKANLLLTASEDELDRMVALNLKGAFLCMQRASRIMMRQQKGAIINISSIAGRYGTPGLVGYAATKGAILSMTTSAAKELGPLGIRVNAVAPGIIDTDLTQHLEVKARNRIVEHIAMRRVGAPEDVAGVVLFLCSDWARYISGQVIGVDGCYVV